MIRIPLGKFGPGNEETSCVDLPRDRLLLDCRHAMPCMEELVDDVSDGRHRDFIWNDLIGPAEPISVA